MTHAAFLEIGLSLLVQSAVLIAVTTLLTRFAKTDRERNRLWVACHSLLLVIVLFGFVFPHIRIWKPLEVSGFDTVRLIALESQVGQWALTIWSVGAGVALLRLIIGSVRAIRILQRSTSIKSGKLPHGCERRINNSTTIQFLTNSELRSPFCWQIHRPIIVLPEFVLAFPNDELRLVIRHEAEHLQRGHPLQLFLQRLVGIVFWFHPAVWWASHQAVACRESACDEAVVTSRREAADYLRSLIRLAGLSDSRIRGAGASVAFGGNNGLIAKRATRLGNRSDVLDVKSNPNLRRLSFLLTLTMGVVLLIWIPMDATASRRSRFSPWPSWSAGVLDQVGVKARDFEVDGHRLRPHEHWSPERNPSHQKRFEN